MRIGRNARSAKLCAAAAALIWLCGCSAPEGADSVEITDTAPPETAETVSPEEVGTVVVEPATQPAKPSELCAQSGAADCGGLADGQAKLDEAEGFGLDDVRASAQLLASKQFVPPAGLAKSAADLNYDQYRRIETKQSSTIWPDSIEGFKALLDPRGYLFATEVKFNVIENGVVVAHPYKARDFNFHDLPLKDDVKTSLGFAGFRVLNVLNKAGKYDELVSFKGASFFRALGAGTVYGASARGLSIGTASAEGEQFPFFTEFWLETPTPASPAITVYALMDGDSVTGAFRFDITPGPETGIEVNATFYPRETIAGVGISPITSMYFFSPHDLKKQADDFRPAVHDSEGLLIWLANGEWVWRPLINPQSLQISVLSTTMPRGFGLIQRKRNLDDYADVEADYHHRPNVWIEPRSDWGAGNLSLVEIPTVNEYNDNVVVFWKPSEAWQQGKSYNISYDMRWSLLAPAMPAVVKVHETRTGKTPDKKRQMFVIDYEPADESLLTDIEAKISTSSGTILHPTIKRQPETGKTRLTFELSPANAEVAELRALLTKGGKPVSETWLYRWRPE